LHRKFQRAENGLPFFNDPNIKSAFTFSVLHRSSLFRYCSCTQCVWTFRRFLWAAQALRCSRSLHQVYCLQHFASSPTTGCPTSHATACL